MAEDFAKLAISIEARLANLESGLAEATKKTEAAANRMSESLEKVNKTGAAVGNALGTYFGVKMFVDLIQGSIEAQAHLDNLGKKTQLTAEQIGGIGFAASQAGSNSEEATFAFGRLNLSLAKAASGNKEAAQLYELVGISVKDASGNARSADAVFADLADKFAGYADGPEKAALGNAIFGRSYQALLPLLADGGKGLRDNIDFYNKYSGVTNESAKAANDFGNSLGQLHVLSSAFGNQLTNALLPTLQTLVDRFIDFRKEGTYGATVAANIGSSFDVLVKVGTSVVGMFQSVVVQIRDVRDTAAAFWDTVSNFSLKSLTPEGAQGIIDKFKAVNDASAKSREQIEARTHALNKEIDLQRSMAGVRSPEGDNLVAQVKPAPAIPPKPSGRTAVDDPAAKQLAATLAMLQEGVKAEQQLLGERNQILDLYNSRGLISIRDYYAQRSNIAKTAFDKEEADTIARVAVLEQALDQAKADKDPTHKPLQKQADIQKQLAQATADLASLREKFGVSQLIDSEKQKFAQEDFNKTLDATSAKVFELQGNLTAAAAINFNQANDSLRKLFSANNNTEGLKVLDTLHAHAIAVAQIAEITQKSAREDEALQNAEERLALAQQAGATGELSTLAAVGKLRGDRLRLMEQEVVAQEASARASSDPTLIQNADKARLALEKLKATVDPLAEKLNGIFENSFNNAFSGFISGSRNAAQAFGDFAKSVINDLLKIASQDIAKSLFGGSGGAGGFLSSLVSLLRGGGNVNTSAGYISGVDMGFSMAVGGTLQPNRVSRVNEHGPELLTVQGKDYLMTGNRAAKVTPVSGGAGGPTINVNIAAGVQRNELAALVPQLKAQIKAEMVASSRRPGYAGAGA